MAYFQINLVYRICRVWREKKPQLQHIPNQSTKAITIATSLFFFSVAKIDGSRVAVPGRHPNAHMLAAMFSHPLRARMTLTTCILIHIRAAQCNTHLSIDYFISSFSFDSIVLTWPVLLLTRPVMIVNIDRLFNR